MSGEHILIVDDEPAIQSALRGVLEDEGYRVTAVGSGEDALALVADETPDLVFMDIWMPGKDGLETLAEIKRSKPEVSVVMISGHGTIETAVRATRWAPTISSRSPCRWRRRCSRRATRWSMRGSSARTRPCASGWPSAGR